MYGFSIDTVEHFNIPPCRKTFIAAASSITSIVNIVDNASDNQDDDQIEHKDEDTCSVITDFSETTPVAEIVKRNPPRHAKKAHITPIQLLQSKRKKWVSSRVAEVLSARANITVPQFATIGKIPLIPKPSVAGETKNPVKSRTKPRLPRFGRANSTGDLQSYFNSKMPNPSLLNEWQRETPHAITKPSTNAVQIAPPEEVVSSKPSPLTFDSLPVLPNQVEDDDPHKTPHQIRSFNEPIRYQSFYVDGTRETHQPFVRGLVPILQVLSQREVRLRRMHLVIEEMNDFLSIHGNASIIFLHTHPTRFYISGPISDLHKLGKRIYHGLSLPSFGLFTVKSTEIILYPQEMINKLANEKENVDDCSSVLSRRSSHESDHEYLLDPLPSPGNAISNSGGELLSESPSRSLLALDRKHSPMSSSSSANVTFAEFTLDVAKRPMRLKSVLIPAKESDHPLLETYHCLNHKSEHLLTLRPSIFCITKLSALESLSLSQLAKLLVKTKPNLEGGFSMELVENKDKTKTAIIYTTQGCEPFMRGIYGDTDSSLWFDVERDTLAKLFGHYPSWWLDTRVVDHEGTKYFIEHYYKNNPTTPV